MISLPSVLVNQGKYNASFKNSQAEVDRNIFHLSDPSQAVFDAGTPGVSLSQFLPKDS